MTGRSPKDWILHVDMDQFIAAVEVTRRPELRGRPVVVGTSGDPTRFRAVVATASYEARRFGIRSGMPLRTAFRRCPEAIFLPSDPAAYEEASARVMSTLRTFPVTVEVWGWDEAFVGTHTAEPETLAAAIQRAVLAETGLSCSVGIGDNKQTAKIAVGFAKPAGIHRLTRGDWMLVMGDRPVNALWGIGGRMTKRLAALGIHSVAELADADPEELAARFGPTMGPWYRELALGGGDSEIAATQRMARSRSREVTFPEDLRDPAEVRGQVARLAVELGLEAVAAGRSVVRVAVKLRFASFFTVIRARKLTAPSIDVDEVERTAVAVLEDRFEHGRPVRLVGVRVELDHADRPADSDGVC